MQGLSSEEAYSTVASQLEKPAPAKADAGVPS